MPIVLDPDKQLIAIELHFIEEQKRHGNSVFHFIRNRDDFNEWQQKGYVPQDDIPTGQRPDKIIQKVISYWKPLLWRDQNNILSKTLRHNMQSDGTTVSHIDAIHYRDLKLKTCLKKWDVRDDQNRPIEVTDDIIDRLNPAFAQELLDSFEKVTEVSEEELGN